MDECASLIFTIYCTYFSAFQISEQKNKYYVSIQIRFIVLCKRITNFCDDIKACT